MNTNMMKKLLLCVWCLMACAACTHVQEENQKMKPAQEESMIKKEIQEEGDEMNFIQLQIGDEQFPLRLYRNDSADLLLARLPMTLEFHELNGNEKYHYLKEPLPMKPEAIKQIHAGDVMLFGSDCLVIFYETFTTSYSYTPIGYIDDITSLKEALRDDVVEIIIQK